MTNCEPAWETYVPRSNGDAPPGFDASDSAWETQFYGVSYDRWFYTELPSWMRGLTYRFRRRPVPPPASLPVMLPEGDAERLDFPMFDGLMAYFPNALAEVARVSKIGNDQHNPGEPMHWARDKSTDHENKIMRHLVDVGTVDPKGVRH